MKTISSTHNWNQEKFVRVKLMHDKVLRFFVAICVEIIVNVSIIGGG